MKFNTLLEALMDVTAPPTIRESKMRDILYVYSTELPLNAGKRRAVLSSVFKDVTDEMVEASKGVQDLAELSFKKDSRLKDIEWHSEVYNKYIYSYFKKWQHSYKDGLEGV